MTHMQNVQLLNYAAKRLYTEIRQGLTPKGKNLLRIFVRQPDRWFTRQDIAQQLERPQMYRHDIELLKLLEERNYLICKRQQAAEIYGERNNIAAQSWCYVYRLNPELRPLLKLIKQYHQNRSKGNAPRSLLRRLLDFIG